MSTAQIAQTIAGLIQQQGQQAAQAREATGAIWGGALRDIGQSAQQTVQAIGAERKQSKLQDIIAKTPKVDLGDGVQGYDLQGLHAAITAAGGDPTPVLQSVGAINQSLQQMHAARLNAVKTGALQVAAAGNNPALAHNFLDTLEANHAFSPAQLKGYRDFIDADPANVAKLTAYFAGPQKMDEARPGSSARNPITGAIVPGSQAPVLPPKPGEGQHVVNGQVIGPDGQPIGAPVPPQVNPENAARDAEIARHNKETERISGLTAGREVAAQQETARHNRAMEAAANPFGGAPAGASGAAGPTGDDFLKTLPAAQQAQIKALAEGRQPFPTGMSYAKLQPLIAAVTQYDPTFDAANYTARAKARTDLTSPSGTGGKTINSLNTAVQHLGKLSDLIEALDNSDTPALNTIANWLSKETGSPKVTNFEAVQPQAMKEIERLWRGAGGSEGDIAALKSSLSTNMGKQQQREALNQFVELVKGKLDSTAQQRDNVLGARVGASIPVLFQQNQSVLDKIAQRATPTGASGAPKDGDVKPIEGHPGTEQTYRNGKWIRTK